MYLVYTVQTISFYPHASDVRQTQSLVPATGQGNAAWMENPVHSGKTQRKLQRIRKKASFSKRDRDKRTSF
jgi:hypothetical protein